MALSLSCSQESPNPFFSRSSLDTLLITYHPEKDSWPTSFGLGRIADQKEMDSLAIAILSDGTGLPPGKGDAVRGASIYMNKCAACHGLTGTEGPEEVLVGTDPYISQNPRVRKTIGNYWPYSTTVFDYIRRAMPSNAPGSLSDEEVYSLTAWLLYKNGIISEKDVMDATSLPIIEMPAKNLFVPDDRTGGATIR